LYQNFKKNFRAAEADNNYPPLNKKIAGLAFKVQRDYY